MKEFIVKNIFLTNLQYFEHSCFSKTIYILRGNRNLPSVCIVYEYKELIRIISKDNYISLSFHLLKINSANCDRVTFTFMHVHGKSVIF